MNLQFSIVLCFALVAALLSCSQDELDFAPPANPDATYSFSLNPNAGSAAVHYNLVDVTQYATKNPGTDSWENCSFLLKGTDRESKAQVYISGKTAGNESYLNVTISAGGSTTFYKDCNSFYCTVSTGSDNFGNYVQLSDFRSGCLTTTLDSERRMDITTYEARLNPFKFYFTQE